MRQHRRDKMSQKDNSSLSDDEIDKVVMVINADDVRQQREKTPSQSLICSEASKLFQDRLL